MNNDEAILAYTLRLGDNALITAQRMVERVAGEPELEEELANANFALDYLGQARMFYSYAGELEGWPPGARRAKPRFRFDSKAAFVRFEPGPESSQNASASDVMSLR